jgi:putative endonuclease
MQRAEKIGLAFPIYYVYIMTSRNNSVLYTGVTGDLKSRCIEHRNKNYSSSFTAQYNVNKLVHYESFVSINDAIAREKQIKAGSRKKKIELIEKLNPQWNDLFETKLANE